MKTLLQIILILGTVEVFGQAGEVLIKGDSLIIRDTNIATNPFNFGKDPLTYLTTKVQPLPKKGMELYSNRHVDNKVDTAFNLEFGKDKFHICKWGNEENAILYAELATNKFSTKHGIRIGMKKTDVVKILHRYKVVSIPKYLVLENSEIIEYLKLDFSGETLKRIEFQGYMD